MPHTSIHDILAEFRDAALNNRDMGDKFERLICRYLELDPQYAERFSNVWLWNEWPLKGQVGDVGIDIVAEEEATGEIVGIQCKFYLPTHTISKADIDTFLSTLGKRQFSSGIIVSTTDLWGRNAEHAVKDQTKPVQRLRVQDLDSSPVDWLEKVVEDTPKNFLICHTDDHDDGSFNKVKDQAAADHPMSKPIVKRKPMLVAFTRLPGLASLLCRKHIVDYCKH